MSKDRITEEQMSVNNHHYPVIRLKKGREKSLRQKHPWVFSGAVDQQAKGLQEGDLVQVVSSEGDLLATGHFHGGNILVRCLDFEGSIVNPDFFKRRISQSMQLRLRAGLPNPHTNCFRLIHGEGDGLPGLVADVYGNTLVIQTYTAGMHRHREWIAEAAIDRLPFLSAVYDKSRETMAKHGTVLSEDGFLIRNDGYTPPAFVTENGMKLTVDFEQGQKTGFFIDQRDNRSLLGGYSKGKSVLNTFCYTGGFTISAFRGGADEVVSVDSSARAIAGLESNIRLNEISKGHHAVTGDVMHFLKGDDKQYDIVVLDPPAYAKHLSQTRNAMIGYRTLNTAGIKKVKPGGLLFTFSCSQAIDRELFRKLVFQSALQAGRDARILHQLSQPADHPVSIFHPEAEYLKGLVLYIP